MPRLSVVTPVRDGVEFAAEYAASVSAQTLGDVEFILIDDHSVDGSVERITELIGSDERLAVLTLTDSAGVAAARNAGVAHASGDHLLFLDEDDAFATPTTLQELSDRLEQAGDPDVAVFDAVDFDFAQVQPCHRNPAPTGWRTLLQQPDAPFTARNVPEILGVSWVAGNKAYRREFVLAAGLSFPPGLYEDAVFSVLGLLQADSICAFPVVYVLRRCCRADSRSQRRGSQHLDVFDQYHRIAQFIEGHAAAAVTPAVYDVITAKMKGFVAELSARPGLLPTGLEAQFHEKARHLDDVMRAAACL